jgi:hypothetical protein
VGGVYNFCLAAGAVMTGVCRGVVWLFLPGEVEVCLF